MKSYSKAVTVTLAALTVGVAACGGTDAAPATGDQRLEGNSEVVTTTAESPGGAVWVLEVAPEGNTARYRVREQLVGVDLPNDAVGTTDRVSGRIALDAQGNVLPATSAIVVEVTDLQSDRARRDGFIRNRLLQAEQYPTVELAPTEVRGLPRPLPTSGTHSFELLGNLTVLQVTRPTTWQGTANFEGDRVTGTAATRFSFDDFNLSQPRVPVVLSVADTIGLEYDFNLVMRSPADP